MRCAKCATENAPDNKFCTGCGAALDLLCAQCGRSVPPVARFCGWCGAPQVASAPLVEPHGERKQATVLFADIVGSTELIADLDAEQAGRRLQPVVAAMIDAVRRFDGTVLGKTGDGLKAIFGAPRAQEGHALMACQAALAMQAAMANQSGPAPIRIRVGLHSGEVAVGVLGDDPLDQEVQGMTLHIASRIEQAADVGGILISAACRDLVVNECDTQPGGARHLKGIATSVDVFHLIGLKSEIGSERFREAGLTRLRGRKRELAFLKQALVDAEHGRGSAIAIVALPGVGKSRLCYEFGEWCRSRGVDVLEARAHVFGRSTPLLPMLEVMRAFFHITPALDAATARRRLEAKLLPLDRSFAQDLPLLSDFLGLPVPELEGQRVDPKARHLRLRDIVKRIVKAAGQRTSVIVFEDLHWLDQPSQDFIETIVEAVSGTNIVAVLNFRPSWTCPWSDLPHYRPIELGELHQDDIDPLVRELMGDDPTLGKLADHIARQSDGNPFFAEELVRALAQSGVLVGERGHYRLASPDRQQPVLPATIEAAVGARLDLLPEREKSLLQIGAVIGKEYPAALVREVASIPEAAATELFAKLSELDLIKPSDTPHGPGFAFRHPLIQEVAYAMLLRTTRTRLHAAVAQAIESFPWGKLDESAGLLAHHCEAAGQSLEAAMHLRRAALWMGRMNSAQALADWKKVRWLLRDQPRGETSDQLRALASGRILGFAWAEGLSAEDVRPYAEEALRFARDAGDHRHEALLLGGFGRVFAASDSADEYIRLAREGVAVAKASGDAGVFVACSAQLSQACLFAGQVREGLAANDAAVAGLDDRSPSQGGGVVLGLSASQIFGFDVPQWLRCLRTRTLVLLGRFDEAEVTLAGVLAVDRSKILPVVQYHAHLAAVEMAWHRGDTAAAERHAAEVERYAVQSQMPYLRTVALFCAGLAASAGGDFAAASARLGEALTLARQSRTGLENEARLLSFLADTHDRAGDFSRTAEVAAEAIDVGRRRTDRIAELHAEIVAAHALAVADPGRRVEAERHFNRAERLIETTGTAFFNLLLNRTRAKLTEAT
jgi:adenylate cyclase